MTRIKTSPLRALVLCLGGTWMLALSASAAPQGGSGQPTAGQGTESSQEKAEKALDEKRSGEKIDLGEINPLTTPASDPQSEMIRLFQEVEGRMNKMGDLLLSASKGETNALQELQTPGIDELLKQAPQRPDANGSGALADMLNATSSQGESALAGIDQILKIANEQGGECSSAMSAQGPPKDSSSNSESPSQKREESGKKKDQSASTPSDGKPQQSADASEQPKDGDQNNATPEAKKDRNPPERATEAPSRRDPKNEAWGNLPIHLRDIFRAEGGVDVPAQYRDWIDSYYRRLNRRSE